MSTSHPCSGEGGAVASAETKCSESPAFAKRLKTSVKKLELRMAQYEADSPPALALQQQIDRTQARFDKYSRSDLLCGADGLPHLIADGRWTHAAEFILPVLMIFLLSLYDWKIIWKSISLLSPHSGESYSLGRV